MAQVEHLEGDSAELTGQLRIHDQKLDEAGLEITWLSAKLDVAEQRV